MAKKKRYYGSKMKGNAADNHGMTKAFEKAAMIGSDYSAMANMPQQVIMKEYPKQGYMSYGEPYDTLRGIDKQVDSDMRKAKAHKSKSKY